MRSRVIPRGASGSHGARRPGQRQLGPARHATVPRAFGDRVRDRARMVDADRRVAGEQGVAGWAAGWPEGAMQRTASAKRIAHRSAPQMRRPSASRALSPVADDLEPSPDCRHKRGFAAIDRTSSPAVADRDARMSGVWPTTMPLGAVWQARGRAPGRSRAGAAVAFRTASGTDRLVRTPARAARPRYHKGPSGSLMIESGAVVPRRQRGGDPAVDVLDRHRRHRRAEPAVDEQRVADLDDRRVARRPSAQARRRCPGRLMLDHAERRRCDPALADGLGRQRRVLRR